MSVSFRAAKTARNPVACAALFALRRGIPRCLRSEEHTSELQSRLHLVCRLLLEKKNIAQIEPERGETGFLVGDGDADRAVNHTARSTPTSSRHVMYPPRCEPHTCPDHLLSLSLA